MGLNNDWLKVQGECLLKSSGESFIIQIANEQSYVDPLVLWCGVVWGDLALSSAKTQMLFYLSI